MLWEQTQLASVCREQSGEQPPPREPGCAALLPQGRHLLVASVEQENKVSIKKETCCPEGQGVQLLM